MSARPDSDDRGARARRIYSQLLSDLLARAPPGIDAVLTWLWLVPTVLAPMWFGSNTPLVWGGHAAVFGLILAAYGAIRLREGSSLAVPLRRMMVPLVALAVVLGWATIQTVPWVPVAWPHPIWAMLPAVIGDAVPGTISLYPAGGRMAILSTATVAVVFLLGVQFGRDAARARLVLQAIAASGGAIAAYGVAVYLSGNGSVLWQSKHAYTTALTATFINPNTFAAYAGVVLICTLGLEIDCVVRRPNGPPTAAGQAALETLMRLLRGGVFLVVSTALVLSGSRAGFAVTALGLALLSILWVARSPGWRPGFFAVLVFGAVALVGLAFGFGDRLAARLPNLFPDFASRLAIDARVLVAIRTSPWLGHGYGAFEQAFAVFRDASMPWRARIEFAHNDWLEALMTLGIPAGLMLWAIFGWILTRCVAGALGRRRDSVFPAVGAGCCVLAITHSLVDFSLQIQGFAIPLIAVLGIAVAQSWPSEAKANDVPCLRLRRSLNPHSPNDTAI